MNAINLQGLVNRELRNVSDLRDGLGEMEFDANEWLDAIEGETDFQEAIEQVAVAVFEADGQAAGLAAMIDRLQKRKSRVEKAAETLRSIIHSAMDKADVKTIKRDFVTLTVKPIPQGLGELDEAQIPSKYFEPQPPKLDKAALRADLKDGQEIPGAKLNNGGSTIQMRFS